ncbi:MAG: di-trans,poly-cis-decaprenylcistransferase [Clostridia bacterium]|nr:di-trans,poly-cis-decaprenylcistransferase [Clostridia bacterium]
MDGNGRWAKLRGLPRSAGHKEGARVMEDIIVYAEKETDIKFLTFYAFSTENWSRPADEIKSLMQLFELHLDRLIATTDKHDIVIKFIGDRSRLSDTLVEKMKKCEEKSGKNEKLTVYIAINYGGRQEIAFAAREVAKKVQHGELLIDEIDEKTLEREIFTKESPHADLIIRPSGEQRLSNFLLWQSAYSEFYFDGVLWPDFTKDDLIRAVTEFNKRNRRFGGI